MNIKSINEFVRFDSDMDLYDLISPSLIYLNDSEVSYRTFDVEEHHEMRIDLVFRDMYNLEPNEVGLYLENIDIICSINNIDNPLNIKRGMSLKYPKLEDLDGFRFSGDRDDFKNKEDVKSRLVVPNKSTKKDKDRQKFKDNRFSLPPVVLEKPRSPVRIKNGRFSVGGL